MLKVLVTGATGYLGKRLLARFVERGLETTGLYRADPGWLEQDGIGAMWLEGSSLRSRSLIKPEFDVVIHTACSYGRGKEPVTDIYRSNVELGLRLIEALMTCPIEAFIYVNTALPTNHSLYSLTKHQFSDLAKKIYEKTETRYVDVRLEHFYGPEEQETKFVSYVLSKLQQDKVPLELTHGEQVRDFIFISDVVSVLEKIMDSRDALAQSSVIPVGSGIPIRIKELAKFIKRVVGSETEIILGAVPVSENDVLYSVADLGSLNRLGWHPNVDLETGIKIAAFGDNDL